ncbi:hypothetical protein Hrubri_2316 [Herbaspirillum rubrisubalbicans M1]|uniref:DUF3540 domain-containing protein n=2 Tax=Herbaspirillum rubrisubalbicans TaxID=80842 RepID=A0AAD0UCW3_9BURK|nr:hypothetical protein Hrubri_2316 [Herbaspirillum rubrisubalbicans M1]AYR24579.1 DUF3540 domain-containing protein [Herbaspirillum rubrisubalbicans]
MHAIESTQATPAPLGPNWSEAQVVLELNDGNYLLDDGRVAQQALSCLLKPCVGDKALITVCQHGDIYILHLLQRQRGTSACLNLPGVQQLTITQPQIGIVATGDLGLAALGDVEVTASSGVLRLNARNLFTTVSESLVENVQHYIGRVGQYLLDVTDLFRVHGQQTSITAEQDVKIDAERISLG